MSWGEALHRNSRSLALGVGRDRFLDIYYGEGFLAHEDGSISGDEDAFRRVLRLMDESGTEDFELETSGGEVAVTLSAFGEGSMPLLAVLVLDRERRETGFWFWADGPSGGWMVRQPMGHSMGEPDAGWSPDEADPRPVAAALAWVLANDALLSETPLLSFANVPDFLLVLGGSEARNAGQPLRVEEFEELLASLLAEAHRVGASSAVEKSVSVRSGGLWASLGTLLGGGPRMTVGTAPGLQPGGGQLQLFFRYQDGEVVLVPSGERGRQYLPAALQALQSMHRRTAGFPASADEWQARTLEAFLETPFTD